MSKYGGRNKMPQSIKQRNNTFNKICSAHLNQSSFSQLLTSLLVFQTQYKQKMFTTFCRTVVEQLLCTLVNKTLSEFALRKVDPLSSEVEIMK